MIAKAGGGLRTVHSAESFSELRMDDIQSLPINEELQAKIHNLLEELGTKSAFMLGFNAFKLTALGYELKEKIHPYRFLLEILSNAPSKENLKRIYDRRDHLLDGRIWSDFTFNLGENFKERKDDIEPYRYSFAEALSVDPEQIDTLQKNEKWADLTLYLAQFN